jgi:hypothetical protein
MSIEDKIEQADYEEAWLDHPITQKRRRELERKRGAAIAHLISTALNSMDPEVRAAAAKYREIDLLVVGLGGVRFFEEVK